MLKMIERVVVRLEPSIVEACVEFPRLGYLTKREILTAMSCRGNVLRIIRILNRVFPAIYNIRFVETLNEGSSGYQIVAVEGDKGEQLRLAVPLAVESQSAVQWLPALERAIRFSLASKLTDCQLEIPDALLGKPLRDAHKIKSAERDVVTWLKNHVLQNVLMAVEIRWSEELKTPTTGPLGGGLDRSCSQLQTAVENAVKILLSLVASKKRGEREQEVEDEDEDEDDMWNKSEDLIVHMLRSIIVCLRLKSDFGQLLLSSHDSTSLWGTHLHYTVDRDIMEGMMMDRGELMGSRISLSSKSSLTESKTSLTSSMTSYGSIKSYKSTRSFRSFSRTASALKPLGSSSHRLSLPPLPLSLLPSSVTASRVSLAASIAEQLQIAVQTDCEVHCGDWTGAYGYEYTGPTTAVLTPAMESNVIALAKAVGSYSFPGLLEGRESCQTETTSILARLLGRHFFQFSCSSLTLAPTLLLLLSTAAQSGSILSLQNPHSLPPLTIHTLQQYLLSLQTVLAKAFRDRSSPDIQSPLCEYILPLPSPLPTPTHTSHTSHTPQTPSSHVASSKLNWYSPSIQYILSPRQEKIEFMGQIISANALFGCCVVFSSGHPTAMGPLKDMLRVVAMEAPNRQLRIEALLQSYGYNQAFSLSRQLCAVMGHLESQLPTAGGEGSLPLSRVRSVLSHASLLFPTPGCPVSPSAETESLAEALLTLYQPQLPAEHNAELKETLRSFFPEWRCRVRVSEREEKELMRAVEEEMREKHLQCSPQIKEKILQLHQSLQWYSCTVLTGVGGSGRTTCYRTLASAYHRIGRPPIHITTINPAAYSWEQLFGGYQTVLERSQWTHGILTRHLSHITSAAHHNRVYTHPDRSASLPRPLPPYWIVLDGPLAPAVLESITALLSEGGLCVGNMERLVLPPSCLLLLKPVGVCPLQPALVGRSGFLYWGRNLVTSEVLVESWLEQAPTKHDLSTMSISYLGNVLGSLVPNSLSFLKKVCTSHFGPLYVAQQQCRVHGLAETQCLLNLFSAVLEKHSPTREGTHGLSVYSRVSSRSSSCTSSRRSSVSLISSRSSSSRASRPTSALSATPSLASLLDFKPEPDMQIPSVSGGPSINGDFQYSLHQDMPQIQVLSILTFSFIWSIGAFVPFSERTAFDDFAHEQIEDMPFALNFPEEDSVFDYYLDLKTFDFKPWEFRRTREKAMGKGFVPIPELTRLAYIVDLYLSYDLNVLLVGEPGTGKTAFVEHLLHSSSPLTSLLISQSLPAEQLQRSIIHKVKEVMKREAEKWGTRSTHSERCLLFFDDLHLGCRGGPLDTLPADAHSPLPSVFETVLSVSNHCCLYDYPQDDQFHIDSIQYIASCRPGQQYTTLFRLLPTFNPVPFLPISDNGLHEIFSSSLLNWFKQYPEAAIGDPEQLSQAVSAASVAVFRSTSDHLRPSLSTPHYQLTLQHLMSVYDGLLLVPLDGKQQMQHFNLVSRKKKSTKKISKGGKKSSAPSRHGSKDTVRPTLLEQKLKEYRQAKPKWRVQDSSEVVPTLHRLVRLWCHENTRVYADRISDKKQRMWFTKLLETCVKYSFCGMRFVESAKSSTTLPEHGRGQVAHRGKAVRMKANAHTEELPFSKLQSSGMRVEILKNLLPREKKEDAKYHELIPFDQVIVRGEDMTGFIFCKLPAAQKEESQEAEDKEEKEKEEEYSEGKERKKGKDETKQKDPAEENIYTELGDGQVMEALAMHLQYYLVSSQGSHATVPNLVLCRRVMEHMTRLCRALVLPGCHALLLGERGSGRRSISRYVIHMMGAELFEVREDDSSKVTKDTLQHVCRKAGVERKSTVLLLICTGHCQNLPFWDNICQLMSNGLCSDLFTSSEMLTYSHKITRGYLKRTPKIVSQILSRSVLRHLHVVVVWDQQRERQCEGSPIASSTPSLHSYPQLREEKEKEEEENTRSVFVRLCHICRVVDHYPPWQLQDLSDSALWWQEKSSSQWKQLITNQQDAICNLAAHVHLTTQAVLDLNLPHLTTHLVSIRTFTECLQLTENIAISLCAKENERDGKLSRALKRLVGVEEAVEQLKGELEELETEKLSVEEQLEMQASIIESCQEKYKAASQRCKVAQETIGKETQSVERLKAAVEQEEGKVDPIYHSALDALSAVRREDIVEMMSYREPPATLLPIFNALCMLFDRPESWGECKQLLLTPRFFQSLQFYDKDNLSSTKVHRLHKMLKPRIWKEERIERGSRAAMSLAMWVSALLDYHQARSAVKPLQARLAAAERVLDKAGKTFVAMQKDMLAAKKEFKTSQKKRNLSLQGKNNIERNIRDIQQRLDEANRLLCQMAPWRRRWHEEKKAIQERSESSPVHALLAAASVCYLGRISGNLHQDLQKNWIDYCSRLVELGSLNTSSSSSHGYHNQKPILTVQKDFSVQELFSSQSERSEWQQQATFPCTCTLEKSLGVRACLEHSSSQWPLVFDPLRLFQGYIRAVHLNRNREPASLPKDSAEEGRELVVLKMSDANWLEELCDGVRNGNTTILVLDQQPKQKDRRFQLQMLLQRNLLTDPALQNALEVEVVSSHFLLILVLEEQVRDLSSSVLQSLDLQLSDFCVVDMELSTEALETHLLWHTMSLERPEFSVRHGSLLADLTLHKKQIKSSQEQVLMATLQSKDLLAPPNIVQTVRDSEQEEMTANDHIKDTHKSLERSMALVKSYQPLAEHSVTIFNAVRYLSTAFHYPNLGLHSFKELVTALVGKLPSPPHADSFSACHGRLLCLQKELLLETHRHLQPSMLRRHHRLLPVLVAVLQLEGAVVSRAELHLLGMDWGLLEAHLNLINKGTSRGKPLWMSEQCWSGLHHLQQQSPTLRGLVASVTSRPEEWREYAELDPFLSIPAPDTGASLTIFHKMLLWKALRPDKFRDIVEEFVILSTGSEFAAEQKAPDWDYILSHTLSSIPIACLIHQERESEGEQRGGGIVECLEAVASSRGVQFHRAHVLDKESFSKVLSQLEQWRKEGWWVMVDQAYLMSNAGELLQNLANMLQECVELEEEDKKEANKNEEEEKEEECPSQQFRLWVPVQLKELRAVGTAWPCVVLGEHGQARTSCKIDSQWLLGDLQQVMRALDEVALHDQQTLPPLLHHLSQLLPHTPPEITPTPTPVETSSPSPEPSHDRTEYFLRRELHLASSSRTALLSSFQWTEEGTTDPLHSSTLAACTLQEVAENRVPRQWRLLLPPHLSSLPSLVPTIYMLQRRLQLASEALREVRLPNRLHPLWVSQPRQLLFLVQQNFAEKQSATAEDVHLQGKVVAVSDFDEWQEEEEEGSDITFHSLMLCGADWNAATASLAPPSGPPTPVSLTLTPSLGAEPERDVCHCPLYATESREDLLCLVPLPPSSSCSLSPYLYCLSEDTPHA